MHLFWMNLFIFFIFIAVTTSLPTENVHNSNVTGHTLSNDSLARATRGIDYPFDAATVKLIATALALHFCTKPPPEPLNACLINVKSLDFNHALIINPHDHSKFLYPDENGNIRFNEGDPVFLSCGNDGNLLNAVHDTPAKTFICVCDDVFHADGNLYKFKSLTCQRYPKHAVVDRGINSEIANIIDDEIKYEFHKYDIGFFTERNSFLKLIEVFYNDEVAATMYVKSHISKSLAGGQSISKAKTRFDQVFCCNNRHPNIDAAYDEATQAASFALQLNNHNTYVKPGTQYVFNRGHLTPKSTQVYTAGALATFVYLNVLPQWKVVNSGNWARIEEHVLTMAKTLKKDLIVLTGSYSGLRLADGNKQLRDMYLHAANEDQKVVEEFPIPLYNVKIVIEPDSKKGVVYVTVNNPYITPGPEYHLCAKPYFKYDEVDVHPPVTMPKQWRPNVANLGYSYMCEVPDFLLKSGFLLLESSAYNVNGLLYIPNSSKAPITTTPYYHDELRKKKSSNNFKSTI